MHTMDAIDRSFSAGYEHGAKYYKEQRDLVLQENAELVGKIEQLEEAVGRMAIELAAVKKERDAAVADLKTVCDYFGECVVCKRYQNGKCSSEEYRIICSKNNSKWEWMGIDE